MYKGLLKVKGTIDLAQFWPHKRSDGDTVTVTVDDEEDAIQFRPSSKGKFRATSVFNDAVVVGQSRKVCINKKSRHVTIRLQGIDAMELHYRATAAGSSDSRTDEQKRLFKQYNKSYRQYFGETSAVALHDKLASAGEDPLSCTVETAVDLPENVFDTYGRLVGDIIVRINGKRLNINQWLVENGYGVPAFYDSMSPKEIDTLLKCSQRAQGSATNNPGTGVWAGTYTELIEPFDFNLVERKVSEPNNEQDRGHSILPKLFRRQTAFEVNRMAGILNGSFAGYIKSLCRKDKVLTRDGFLKKGSKAPKYCLDKYVTDEKFLARPEDLVFTEAPSALIGPDRKKIKSWW